MKKSIVRLLAVGMLLGGAIVPATVTNDGLLSPVTTTQTAKAATTDKEQTIDFDVLKTGTNNASISSQYFTKTAKITPNSDGTYKVTIQVSIPTIASVNILTMGGQKVTDSDKYKTDSGTYQDISFNINDVSDLKNPLNSSMKIQVMGLGLMNQTADFKFDMSTLKDVKSDNSSEDKTPAETDKETDTNKDDQTVDTDNYDDELDPTQIGETGNELIPQQIGENSGDSEDGTKVTVGDPIKIATTHYDDLKNARTIDFSVLKEGTTEPSVSTQYFNQTAKVTPNDDGTYKVTIQVTIPSIAQVDIFTMGDQNVNESEQYTTDSGTYKDISFNVNDPSELGNLLTSSMRIQIPSLSMDMSPKADFKFDLDTLSAENTEEPSTTDPSTEEPSTTDNNGSTEVNDATGDDNDTKEPAKTSDEETQSNKASDKTPKLQTITFDVYKTGTNNKSISSQYFTKTAKITPNSDGTYKVTIQVKIPSIASVDILTMNGKKVTDSDEYKEGSTNYQDISFNIDDVNDLKNPLESTMKIKVIGLGLMNQTADFKFDMDSLKTVESGDDKDSDTKPSTDGKDTDKEDDELIPDQIGDDSDSNSSSSSEEGSSVAVGDQVNTDSTSTNDQDEIPYQVLKEDPSQGESVSTQFFTGKAKVTKNDDGTYKVMMTLTYPTTFGEKPVTIDSINGGSINAADTKTYSKDGKNFMDFSFNIQSKSALDQLIPCTMTIDVSQLGFNSTESVNFKFNATSSGVAGATTTGTSGTNGTGVYGSTSGWPSSATSANPSTTNSTLPQTGDTTRTAVLTAIGVSVAAISAVLFRNFYKAEFDK